MYFVGIDISKYKHDCFITTETGEVIKENLSFSNDKEGFQKLLDLLKSLNNNQEIRIGFEATGHYHMNLMLFLEENNFSFMELNPALVKNFISTQTLRRTKTDKVDAIAIASYLMFVNYKPHPKQFYHKYSLKSLCRSRESLAHQRSYYKVRLTNILDLTFPEFKPFFKNKFATTSLFILNKYKNAEKISKMKDYDSIRKVSRGKFTYPQFLKLKELAKDTVGTNCDIFNIQLDCMLSMLFDTDKQVTLLDDKISDIIKELNPKSLGIRGIGYISCASIISEFGDFSRFKSADACVAFAGVEPSVIQSGTASYSGRMVKHGSPHLRATIMNVADFVFMHEPIFTVYYYKKRDEGKSHRVALSHVAKKLIRVIYKLETSNINFNPAKLR